MRRRDIERGRVPQNLKPLTSLRFFAALWVVAFDYWPTLGVGSPALVAKGYLGVELFFVLSGFILSHVYLDEAQAGRLNYGGFLWARLARIYPLHLATIVAIGLMGALALALGVGIEHPVLVWSALPQNLLLVHAWGTTRVSAWNHPSWSISAEWFAYVFFPLAAWGAAALRDRPRLAVLGAAAFVVLLYPAFEAARGVSLTQVTTGWGPLRIAPCFLLGCAVNLLWRRRPLRSEATGAALSLLALAGVAAAAFTDAPDLVPVLMFGSLIYGLASMASSGTRFLTAPMLVHLGEVSFAVYMVCVPWQFAFAKAASLLFGVGDVLPLWLWLLQLVGLIAAAAVAHHLVERPARILMRLHDPFRPRNLPASVPASAAATL